MQPRCFALTQGTAESAASSEHGYLKHNAEASPAPASQPRTAFLCGISYYGLLGATGGSTGRYSSNLLTLKLCLVAPFRKLRAKRSRYIHTEG